MMAVYKEMFPLLGGYLTKKNQIHLPRLELFLQEIARREPLYFQQRSIEENEQEYANQDQYKRFYYHVTFVVLFLCLFICSSVVFGVFLSPFCFY
jgi:5'-3' exonuclease